MAHQVFFLQSLTTGDRLNSVTLSTEAECTNVGVDPSDWIARKINVVCGLFQ